MDVILPRRGRIDRLPQAECLAQDREVLALVQRRTVVDDSGNHHSPLEADAADRLDVWPVGHNDGMARADLLVALIRAGASGDRLSFERAAEAIIAEEAGKRHDVLASQLSEALQASSRTNGRSLGSAGAKRSGPAGLFHEIDPERQISSLVLPDYVRRSIDEFVEEHHRRDLLRSYGYEPRNRVLLVGPPGSGKTSLAESIASSLMFPLLSVRYEGLIGSYLGETAARMDDLFSSVRVRPCVLFFDEFDTVAKERGDTHETGEIKRVVSSLLLQVDRLPSHVIVVTATNHPELLDRAVWRRMQLRLELPRATRAGMVKWITNREVRTGIKLGLAPRTIAEHLKGLSYAELEEFFLDVERRVILEGAESDTRAITASRISLWSKRAGEAE